MADFFKDKNILVTGGTGFVGSHLVEELIGRGARVISTYLSFNPHSYFFSQKLDDKAVLVRADVANFEKIFDIVTRFEIDYIFHLAAQALVETAYFNPRRTYSSNVMGTVNILEAARLYSKVVAVIVASSDKAYGKMKILGREKKRQYIESDPLKGDHPYEASKSSADLISYSYYKTYGLPVTITRFANIYGEGDLNFSRIIPGILRSVITRQRLDIRSNGRYVRDYLYVKDVVDGYLLLAENIGKVKGEAFNFGSNETYSVLELIDLMRQLLNKKINYRILNTAKNEIPYQSLNFQKIKKMLGWQPKRSLKKVSQKIYLWYKKILTR